MIPDGHGNQMIRITERNGYWSLSLIVLQRERFYGWYMPLPNGKFDKRTQDDLRWVGKWLKVNGEAIYGTRGMFVEDDNFKFTRSKDSQTIYAIHKGWKTGKINISNISDVKEISILGTNYTPEWKQVGDKIELSISDNIDAPSEYAFVLKIIK